VVTGLEVADITADLLNYASRLMAHYGRRRMRVEAIHEVQIAMAYATGNGAHQDFALVRLVDSDIFDNKRMVGSVKNRGFH
jgi:hypothetical protein